MLLLVRSGVCGDPHSYLHVSWVPYINLKARIPQVTIKPINKLTFLLSVCYHDLN